MQTTTRHSTLDDLAEMLKSQHAAKLDVVAPASQIRAVDGNLVLRGTEPIITEDGVTEADGVYRPTVVADEGLADKLGIPVGYLKGLRKDRPFLYDANVNGWLHGKRKILADGTRHEVAPGDDRSFLVRCFRDPDGGEGVARAVLSDRYQVIDHLDALLAALDGVRASGTHVEIDSCDLTDRRMTVRVVAPEIQALAPVLLDGYRRPWGPGQAPWETAGGRAHGWLTPDERPVMFAGLVISNSETGGGAFTITPRLMVKVCRNGLVVAQDAVRAVHLGGKLDDGVVRWSDETQAKALDLVKAKTADAVASFLDVDYMRRVIERAEEKAGRQIEQPQQTIQTVCKKLAFTQAQADGILEHFIRGGQTTAGGVMQAVTAYAQTLDDGDAAFEMENAALRALDLAAAN